MILLSLAEYEQLQREDFATFIERAFHELNPGTPLVNSWYLELMADKLEQVRLGRIKRLIINLPPRSLKTHIASVCLPGCSGTIRPARSSAAAMARISQTSQRVRPQPDHQRLVPANFPQHLADS